MSEHRELDARWAEQMQLLRDRMTCAAIEFNESLRALKPALDAIERARHDEEGA